MSDELNRPIVKLNADGSREFAQPPTQLYRVKLVLARFDVGTRAELWEWRPGMKPGGHVVWQYHTQERNDVHTAPIRTVESMSRTADWLATQGWPGVAL